MPLKTGFSRYCSRGHVHGVGVHRDRDGLVPETDLLASWDGRCRLVTAGYDRGMFVAVADEPEPCMAKGNLGGGRHDERPKDSCIGAVTTSWGCHICHRI